MNKTVAEADLVCRSAASNRTSSPASAASTEPHPRVSAGYHCAQPCAELHTFPQGGEQSVRMDLEEAGALLKPPVFMSTRSWTPTSALCAWYASTPLQPIGKGATQAGPLNAVQVAAPADVVIADSHPMDSDLRQGVKALTNTIRAVRRGGVLIVLVRAQEGTGVLALPTGSFPSAGAFCDCSRPFSCPWFPGPKIAGLGRGGPLLSRLGSPVDAGTPTCFSTRPPSPRRSRRGCRLSGLWPMPRTPSPRPAGCFPGKAEVLGVSAGGITYPEMGAAD